MRRIAKCNKSTDQPRYDTYDCNPEYVTCSRLSVSPESHGKNRKMREANVEPFKMRSSRSSAASACLILFHMTSSVARAAAPRYTRFMRLWIDVREACVPRKTGKGFWTYRCIGALLSLPGVRATLLTNEDVPTEWKSLPGLADVRIIPRFGIAWHLHAWRMVVRERAAIDAYVSSTSFIVPFLLGRSVPVVPVVHDLIAFKREPHHRKAKLIERLTLPRALRTAHAVCSVSETTAAALWEKFSCVSPIIVTGAGSTLSVRPWDGTGDFVLSVGTLCPRKNQLRLIRAFASLKRTDLRLVLVGGRGWDDDAIVEAAATTPNVEWRGYLSDEDIVSLLVACRVFAWVSEDEGFGLPVLDALRAGAPVVASDIPSNREVAGQCATYVDPHDVSSIAVGLSAALEVGPADPVTVRAHVGAFTWERSASRLLDACRNR